MAQIIATANMKGGVGKTTLTVNLATALAKEQGKRVLVVDLDTQISATLSLVSPHEFSKLRKERRTLKHLINDFIQPISQHSIPIQDAIKKYVGNQKGLDLLPGDLELYDEFTISEFLHEKAVRLAKEDFNLVWNKLEKLLVAKILEPVSRDYDFIILDCAPGYNLLTRSALVSSDFYLIPAKPEPLSLIGIQLLQRRINQLRETYKDDEPLTLELMGIVFTMSSGLLNGRYYKQVMRRVHDDFGEMKIFKTRIPNDINVSKAVDSFLPVMMTNPGCAGSKAFAQLSEEVMAKLKVAIDMKQQKRKLNLVNLD
ncbi:ParA family protein [Oxynema aestuarii]|jgi:cellulose biosynthesis protein BcsQ|uniref:ParA family protein n=1 Tax=Oxynema aestuarii AP17 TaxID=2064643 RepID=A0A6H1TWL8_9CYAN|nr:ParA family protein [Oxynema aestuarii]QIZ69729.1 ParA family protein [Oxynema aestuarii AP17]RMH78734.1 MAG: ParA family protein [Cyanobacteria bacterium J007]